MALWGPKIKKVPPLLDLMPQEILVLAAALLYYPTAFAMLCSCQAQLHWSFKYFRKQKEPERVKFNPNHHMVAQYRLESQHA